jgi:DNA-binding NarL/FixJ family response regulator
MSEGAKVTVVCVGPVAEALATWIAQVRDLRPIGVDTPAGRLSAAVDDGRAQVAVFDLSAQETAAVPDIRDMILAGLRVLLLETDGDPAARRPQLSHQEHAVFAAYASGMTLETTARNIGIRPTTARTYLRRVKAKYEEIGRPAHTKIDLAARLHEDYPRSR